MVSFSYLSTSIRIMINRSISSGPTSVLPDSMATLHSSGAWLFAPGRQRTVGGKGTPERGQLFTQMARQEFGQGLVQGEQHCPRIASGAIQIDALLIRHASQEGPRGEAGHGAVE